MTLRQQIEEIGNRLFGPGFIKVGFSQAVGAMAVRLFVDQTPECADTRAVRRAVILFRDVREVTEAEPAME